MSGLHNTGIPAPIQEASKELATAEVGARSCTVIPARLSQDACRPIVQSQDSCFCVAVELSSPPIAPIGLKLETILDGQPFPSQALHALPERMKGIPNWIASLPLPGGRGSGNAGGRWQPSLGVGGERENSGARGGKRQQRRGARLSSSLGG